MKTNRNNTMISTDEFIPTVEFYSQVINSLQDYAIFTINNDLLINSWNPASYKMFGYKKDEVMGAHFNFIFTGEDINNGIPKAEIETALRDGKAGDNRYHRRKDGSTFLLLAWFSPLRVRTKNCSGLSRYSGT